MDSALHRTGYSPDNFSGQISYRDFDRRRFGRRFGAQLVRSRIVDRLFVALSVAFRIAADLRFGAQAVAQVIRERRAEGRVVSRVEIFALKALAATPDGRSLHVFEGILDGKQNSFFLERLGSRGAQRRGSLRCSTGRRCLAALPLIPRMLGKRRGIERFRKLSPREVKKLILEHRIPLKQLMRQAV